MLMLNFRGDTEDVDNLMKRLGVEVADDGSKMNM